MFFTNFDDVANYLAQNPEKTYWHRVDLGEYHVIDKPVVGTVIVVDRVQMLIQLERDGLTEAVTNAIASLPDGEIRNEVTIAFNEAQNIHSDNSTVISILTLAGINSSQQQELFLKAEQIAV